jgi:SAM-dependent methyltransferase
MSQSYSQGFYKGRQSAADRSAEALVPILLSYFPARSVIDVGCGSGSWVKAFAAAGVPEVLGVDGPWASKHNETPFLPFDFASETTPFRPPLPRSQYDLAISLEFVEHVPEARADALVEFLTSISPVVVLGAAVPGQGGTGHVNEQWPSHWRQKFEARGYEACDFLRALVWEMSDIQSWYRQNTIVYFRGGVPRVLMQRVVADLVDRVRKPMAMVHPEVFASKLKQKSILRQMRVRLGRTRRALFRGS